MELCRVPAATTAFAWTNSISSTLQLPQTLFVGVGPKRFRVWCVNGNIESQKESQMVVSVTGATGFVGKRLVQRLHADKHQIRVLTRSRSKAQSIFPGKKLKNFQDL
uniref:Epimerase family protein SDR39U1 homolog, chloroplastic-like isoform X2 n=1 Tax=Nicotiana tabacum TaxID=4097 RepID=A0A1S3YV37_TOBAC|nr:PREDICTED: epimerase family protein SDR39U1 homolog, chloroplastic-like isoform X2 [Nicotiana tabacum]